MSESENPHQPAAAGPEANAAGCLERDGAARLGGPSRRGTLVGLIAAAVAAFLAVPMAGFALFVPRRRREQWIRLGPAESFRGPRQQVEYVFAADQAWLSSTARRRVLVAAGKGSTEFTVFSTACTHLGCPVRWDEESHQFLCPCHGGVYDAEGRPTLGPPPRPLDRLAARVTPDGQLEVREG